MLFKIPFTKIDVSKLNIAIANENGDYENTYIILVADEDTIEAAIDYASKNAWVVGIEYASVNFAKLNEVDFNNTNVYITYNSGELTPEAIANIEYGFATFVNMRNPIKVVINTPPKFSNMQIVKAICNKYPTASFSGGDFLRLPDCRYGAIGVENYPKPVKSKWVLRASGSCEWYPVYKAETTDYIFGEEPCIRVAVKSEKRKTKSSTPKEPKAPKQKKSRFGFASSGGLSAF